MFWIPLIGPIIQGITSIFGSISNVEVTKLQTQSETTIAETKASARIIEATRDDICLRILRDALCLPVVAWCLLGGWDTIVAIRYPWLMFHVSAFPRSMSMMPYAVITFLLGNIGLNMWNKR